MNRPAQANALQLMVAVPSPEAPAIQVEVVAARRLVLLKYAHSPAIPEWTDAMDAVLADRDYRAGFGFLLDQRGNRCGPSLMFITAMVRYLSVHQDRVRGARWAVVVDAPAAYGMARAGKALAADLPLEMAVFLGNTPDSALRWVRRVSDRNTPRGRLENGASLCLV